MPNLARLSREKNTPSIGELVVTNRSPEKVRESNNYIASHWHEWGGDTQMRFNAQRAEDLFDVEALVERYHPDVVFDTSADSNGVGESTKVRNAAVVLQHSPGFFEKPLAEPAGDGSSLEEFRNLAGPESIHHKPMGFGLLFDSLARTFWNNPFVARLLEEHRTFNISYSYLKPDQTRVTAKLLPHAYSILPPGFTITRMEAKRNRQDTKLDLLLDLEQERPLDTKPFRLENVKLKVDYHHDARAITIGNEITFLLHPSNQFLAYAARFNETRKFGWKETKDNTEYLGKLISGLENPVGDNIRQALRIAGNQASRFRAGKAAAFCTQYFLEAAKGYRMEGCSPCTLSENCFDVRSLKPYFTFCRQRA